MVIISLNLQKKLFSKNDYPLVTNWNHAANKFIWLFFPSPPAQLEKNCAHSCNIIKIISYVWICIYTHTYIHIIVALDKGKFLQVKILSFSSSKSVAKNEKQCM